MHGRRLFPFDEAKYYLFGLGMGFRNLAHNGMRLGAKKTIGKILQPINSYTRFPEYSFMESKIEAFLRNTEHGEAPKVLDVSSPKCFSLYLAYHYDVIAYLTDIDRDSVQEAEVLWDAIKADAKGKAIFSVEDGRSLKYPNSEFSVVFSMSVIEHIEGESADSAAMRELTRVLKPGGLLAVTVPIGNQYLEQQRVGFRAAAQRTGDQSVFFFQRIYTPQTATERLVNAVPEAALLSKTTACRSDGVVSRMYLKLGENLRGLLGFLSPLLSASWNYAREGAVEAPSRYGALNSPTDIYGDLMLAWQKLPDQEKSKA